MIRILFFILFLELISCTPYKDIQIKNSCDKTLIDISKSKLIFPKNKKYLTLMFMDGFDFKTQLFLNETLLFDKKIKTDFSLSYAGEVYFPITNNSTIKIYTEDSINNCLEFNVNQKYRYIFIYKFGDKLKLIYSNQKNIELE
ncbi:hypothetical protein OBJ99_11875 [Empedobacter falsenii]